MILGYQTSHQPRLDSNFLQNKDDLELYCKGDEISLSNAGFYQVYRGVVQLYRVSEDQQETVVGWVTANHAFGNSLNDSARNCKAIALSDVYVRYYEPAQVKRNPRLARLLVSELAYRLLKSEQMVVIHQVRRVEDRLKALLQMLKGDLGISLNYDQSVRLTARFTHQNLADAICTTRVTITRILGEWHRNDLIEFDCDRHLIIKF